MRSPPPISLPKKPTYVPLATDIDLLAFFQVVEQSFDTCFLFESLGETAPESRYTIMGFDPRETIRARGRELSINEKIYDVENPYVALQAITPRDHIARRYAGGLVGYMGYDAVNYLEPTVHVQCHPYFDQFVFGVYTDGVIFDTVTRELFYFYYDEDRTGLVHDLLQKKPTARASPSVYFAGETLTPAEHERMVAQTKEQIAAGRVFQCEVGFQAQYRVVGDTLRLYEDLRQMNPSPYMYYMKFGEQKILGASPELLLEVSDKEIITSPLAGTIRRGATDEEDAQLARQLLHDSKEKAEHVMLVDMHRNDIGRVSKIGTVNIRRFMEIKKYSHVQHISSTIAGILGGNENMFTALASLLPGGVLSGAPKIEAIKIIAAQETTPRGPYGGAIGHFGFNGDCTFAIPIRSLFIHGEEAYTQTCSGIVADSSAADEYDEVKRKMAALQNVLSAYLAV